MQTNVMCSLLRKGKFPDQKLGVLLEVPISRSTRPPGLNCMPFPVHQLGFIVALWLEVVGWRCFFQFVHCWCVQPFASHGVCFTGAGCCGPPCFFFFATKFFGVVFVGAIIKNMESTSCCVGY